MGALWIFLSKCATNWLRKACSINLEMYAKFETGRKDLDKGGRVGFFRQGIIFSCLNSVGYCSRLQQEVCDVGDS